MGTTKQRGLTKAERTELWDRWKHGQSLSDIARALSKAPGSIHGYLSIQGGIAPLPRIRAAYALSAEDREEISRGLCAGRGIRQIARELGRPSSTVSREVARNGGRHRYRAAQADVRAWAQAKRPKPCKLATAPRLQRLVAAKLQLDWSPEQIAGWLKVIFPDDERMHVSHETIYRSLFVQARGVLRKELMAHLRSRRVMRRARKSTVSVRPTA